MFCPRCGKEDDGLCANCYLELHPLKIKGFKIAGCSCGRYLYKGNWVRIDEMIDDWVMRNILIAEEITIKDVEVVIEIMGQPEEIIEEEEVVSEEDTGYQKSWRERTGRRVYRDPDNLSSF